MMRWLRQPAGDSLAVSMSSIKLGDRLLIVGASDVTLIVALATKAGLTGRTCIVDASDTLRTRAASIVEREGALVESFTAAYSALPFEPAAFDVAIVRNVLGSESAHAPSTLAAELYRVLRPGGRCVVIEGSSRGGLAHLFRRNSDAASATTLEQMLKDGGFRGVRTLAEREALLFVEGVKPGEG